MRRVLLLLVMLMLFGRAAMAFDPLKSTGIVQKQDSTVPMDQGFFDENSVPVTLRELAGGRPILLAPVLHNCPNICDVTLAGLMQAVQDQHFHAGRDFVIVAFGIDSREGPKDAAASMKKLKARFPWLDGEKIHGLTGSSAAISKVMSALGYRYAWDQEIGQYAHIAATAVLTPTGKLTHWLYGLAPEASDLSLALTEAGEGQVGDWGDQILLLCYHYDPKTGRYSSIIWTSLRIGGAATIVVVVSLIGSALLRERARRGGT
ncbi:SCO family protein [Dongia soli]|uniref:SCO family protein n=1 Tax=Dongia soli TaxID=600628 RepID=A0ABU5EER0_9PROT|nr:SCO family protein [Dongia soli]MDY0884422.1 SCO family protein [Dongia soli]